MKWYPIPPYRPSESWVIHNEKGEFVATFEDRKECEKVCELWNSQSYNRPLTVSASNIIVESFKTPKTNHNL